MHRYRVIAALGSSFAAGPGIEPVEDPVAMRSSRNYPHLLADRLGSTLVDLTVAGASTATIVDTPQITVTGAEVPPQIEGLPADADVVTITAGGNDLNFASSMLYAAWRRHEPDGLVSTMLGPQFPAGLPNPTEADVEAMADGLTRIVAEVRRKAPVARVLLVDYVNVVDRNTARAPGVIFTTDEVDTFLRLQDAIAGGYRTAAKRSGAEVLHASELSRGHSLGSADPWVFDFRPELDRTAASFHPNEAAMAAIADALVSILDA